MFSVLESKSPWSRGFPSGPLVKTSHTGGVGFIHSQGFKIPHVYGQKKQNIKWKQCCNEFNEDFKSSSYKKWLPWWLNRQRISCQYRKYKFNLWVRIFLEEENGNPLQNSCLKHPTTRGTWRATVKRVTKSQTQLSK